MLAFCSTLGFTISFLHGSEGSKVFPGSVSEDFNFEKRYSHIKIPNTYNLKIMLLNFQIFSLRFSIKIISQPASHSFIHSFLLTPATMNGLAPCLIRSCMISRDECDAAWNKAVLACYKYKQNITHIVLNTLLLWSNSKNTRFSLELHINKASRDIVWHTTHASTRTEKITIIGDSTIL